MPLDDPAVLIQHLHRSYGAKVAVDDVSLTVAPGEILGDLGPNGVTLAAARLAYDAQMPGSWPEVLAAYVVGAVAFAVLGVLLGLRLPSSRAAQGVGHPALLHVHDAGRGGPPREVMPTSLGVVSDVVALTYAARLLRAPWLRGDWDHHRHRGDGRARGRGTRPDRVAGAVLGRDLTRWRRCV